MSTTTSQPKKKRKMLTSFSIILILLAVVALITIALNGHSVTNEQGDVITITGANLGQFMMAPVKGFNNAVDVCLFIMVLGGFLGIVTKTEALNIGIAKLVRKMGGNEIKLIPVLMLIFAVLGSTYGFCEETVGFYALLAATMMAAGFDALTGAAMILLGAAVGCLGSTVNPFATGIATSAANDAFKDMGLDLAINQAVIIALGLILLVAAWLVSVIFVMRYAKKVKANPSDTAMTAEETQAALETYGEAAEAAKKDVDLTGKQKAVLWVFAAAFLVMIIGFVPWEDLGVNFFNAGYSEHEVVEQITPENANQIVKVVAAEEGAKLNLVNDVVFDKISGTTTENVQDSAGWSAFLTNVPLGQWYFAEATTWFLLLAIIIGVIGGLDEHTIVNEFMSGCGDMISVVMVVALSRGVSVLMTDTGLSPYFLNIASDALKGTSGVTLTVGSYLLYFVLSFLIPSTSGMATVSMPIMAPLAAKLSFNPAVMIMIFSAASGAVNMITPTNGAIMGGLALARVEYGTWFKFALKIVAVTAVVSIVILTIASMVL